jgi:hypothetical protein
MDFALKYGQKMTHGHLLNSFRSLLRVAGDVEWLKA